MLRARLNHLRLLLDTAPWRLEDSESVNLSTAFSAIQAQIQPIAAALDSLPPTCSNLDIRINLANQLLDYQSDLTYLAERQPSELKRLQEQQIALPDSEQLLSQATEQAAASGDLRSQAYALGVGGRAAAQRGDFALALKRTDEAVVLAKRVNAPEILYRWYEQRGQILEARGEPDAAIAAYGSAVQTLKTLRTDLIAVNPEVLFSFQKSVEPTYRRLMTLLIAQAEGQSSRTVASQVGSRQIKSEQRTLDSVRRLVESLQQDELTNFLQADCLQSTKVDLENIEGIRETAFIYPIVLPDQLAIIASLPGPAGSGERELSR